VAANLKETMIIIGGCYNLAFAVFHMFFWRIFRWEVTLASLNSVNRAIMQVLNLHLTFVFLVMAYVSVSYANELIGTGLGKVLLLASSLFWFFRVINQIIFFKLKNTMSIVFTVIFLLGGVLYLIPILK
jgi:hypothetical protein